MKRILSKFNIKFIAITIKDLIKSKQHIKNQKTKVGIYTVINVQVIYKWNIDEFKYKNIWLQMRSFKKQNIQSISHLL